MLRPVLSFLALLVMLIGIAGCGASFGTVTGKVTYKGSVLKGGNITLINADGRGGGSSRIQEDGSYTLERMPVGAAKICVETKSLIPAARGKVPKYAPPPGMKGPNTKAADPTEAAKRYRWIPETFGDPEKTTLNYTVVGGAQVHDFSLDSP